MPRYPDEIEYSETYEDDHYVYRHVILPKCVAKRLFELTSGERLLTESEWRGLGVQMRRGWAHYEIYRPEPHILLVRRPRAPDPGSSPNTVNLTLHTKPLDAEGFLPVASTTMDGSQTCQVRIKPETPVRELRAMLGAELELSSPPSLILPDGIVLFAEKDGTSIADALLVRLGDVQHRSRSHRRQASPQS